LAAVLFDFDLPELGLSRSGVLAAWLLTGHPRHPGCDTYTLKGYFHK
jgi:hypothetical protein